MAEIDVMRAMASEHDLEFVDLTNFGVDPTAAAILNEEVARQLHVAAIKRKFGTPVVATSEPDDLGAQDAVRTALGRDFISVVATLDQIDAYLDRMFPPERKPEETGGKRSRRKRKSATETETKDVVPPESPSPATSDFFSAERVLADARTDGDDRGPGGDPELEAVPDVDVGGDDVGVDGVGVAGDAAEEGSDLADPASERSTPPSDGAGEGQLPDGASPDGSAEAPAPDVSAEPGAAEVDGEEGGILERSEPDSAEAVPDQDDPALLVEAVTGEIPAFHPDVGEPTAPELEDLTTDGEDPVGSVAAVLPDATDDDSAAVSDDVDGGTAGEDASGSVPQGIETGTAHPGEWDDPGEGADGGEAGGSVEFEPSVGVAVLDPLDTDPTAGPAGAAGNEDDVLGTVPLSGEPALSALVDELQSTELGTGVGDDAPEALDLPAFDTSVFAPTGSNGNGNGIGNGNGGSGGPDELVDLVDSLQQASVDAAAESGSSERAADLVDEAVASYEEQHAASLVDDGGDRGILEGLPALARILVQGGRVPLDQMQEALAEHDRNGQSIARVLSVRKLVTEADLMWAMATELGLEFVDLDLVGVSFTDAGTIPEATARHHNVLVIANENGVPVVATANPTDVFAIDDLRTIMRRDFTLVVAAPTQITEYIGRVFDTGGGDAANMAMEASLDLEGGHESSVVDDIQAVTEEAPIVRYVNLLILQALNERASDVHVEPSENELRIRYRIDGVLHDASTAPRSIAAAVITRLKVMADLNVAEHRVPQDGRISLNVGAKGIDLRVATLPTIHGEKIVMRVLDKSSVVLGFNDLGFPDDLLERYEAIYTKPYGTILVTGPTGSGKSTTLYTTLTALNNPEKNIITVEDPVELQLKGVNQVQLNIKAGLTFASALKSILRSDPDIVLVGEIRDEETALIAIEAALTGHLVLSTLHTNSAAATPMRLIEMGIQPFLVTSSLTAVLAQRLARRLCMHCKETKDLTEADIEAAGWTVDEVEELGGMFKAHVAVGCSACANTGYRGRMALSELMPMTEEIERCIIEGGSVDDIHRLAVSQGMQTLRQSGLRKAIEGETTLEEVLRVVA